MRALAFWIGLEVIVADDPLVDAVELLVGEVVDDDAAAATASLQLDLCAENAPEGVFNVADGCRRLRRLPSLARSAGQPLTYQLLGLAHAQITGDDDAQRGRLADSAVETEQGARVSFADLSRQDCSFNL